MANPIEFRTRTDPRKELQRKLDAAPLEHAEALLLAFDVLEVAHQKGLLDLLHGAVGSKNAIAAKVAEYASEPQSTQAMRNLLILGKVFGSIDSDALGKSTEVFTEHGDRKPPSMWESFKVLRSDNGRRGLYSVALLLRAFGSAGKPK